MHFLQTVGVGLFANLAAVSAQLTTCNGNVAPDWDDCEPIRQRLQDLQTANGGNIDNIYPGCNYFTPLNGEDPDTLNCQIFYCPDYAGARITGPDVYSAWILLENSCRETYFGGSPAGGDVRINDAGTLTVTNNPSYGDTRQAEIVAEDIIVERDHARAFPKRQAEGDTDFVLVTRLDNVERGGIQVSGRQPAGGVYRIDETDSLTTGITSSVEAGGSLFEIFSASVSIEATEEFTTTNTLGLSLNIDCESRQSGIVYWYPLYTVYQGFYTPSNTNVDWVVPQDSQISGSNYRVTCLE